MRKLIKILITIIIVLVIFIVSYNFVFSEGKEAEKESDEPTSEQSDADSLHQDIEDTIKGLDGDEETSLPLDESIDDKLEELDDVAKKASDKRDDKLGEDTLKSSGTKYSGVPCKESCW